MRTLKTPVIMVKITWSNGSKDDLLIQDTERHVYPDLIRDHLREAKRDGRVREYSVDVGEIENPVRPASFMSWLNLKLYGSARI